MTSNNKDNSNLISEGDETTEVEESSLLGGEQEPRDEPEEATIYDRQRASTAKLIKLLPVHAVGGPNVVRQVGRPRPVTRRPTAVDLEYHQEMSEERQEFIETDAVVQATVLKSDTADTLQIIKQEVAREAASLRFQRIENEKHGRDTAQISTRRIDALTKIANIELEIKKLGADTLNLKSEKFQKIFALMIASFREVCVEINMSPEQVDLLFNRLSSAMEGWEDRAAEAIR